MSQDLNDESKLSTGRGVGKLLGEEIACAKTLWLEDLKRGQWSQSAESTGCVTLL